MDVQDIQDYLLFFYPVHPVSSAATIHVGFYELQAKNSCNGPFISAKASSKT